MTKSNNSGCHLLLELVKLLISLLDLLVQGLVLDLKLFEINQVKSISELFLLLELFIEIGEVVSHRDHLESVLVEFLILLGFFLLPILNSNSLDLLSCSSIDS